MGVETEYAINGMCGQDSADRAAIVSSLLDLARALPNVRDATSSGMFLENGARLYLDTGLHVEYATPECPNPWDAARYVEAGHRTMLRLLEDFARGPARGVEAGCFRVNVDYCGSGATWGCHESYLHKVDPSLLAYHLIPHLVSRIIYSGAGGFEPFSAGLRFTLSPRAAHIQQAVSSESTRARGIFHTKDEPLCSDYHRLHVLCGENLASQRAMFVKFGATCLVVAMVEAGLEPGLGVQLASPLEALRTVASDLTLRQPLRVERSAGMTALAIQKHYLALAEAHQHDPFMPPWAPALTAEWRRLLERLEEGPAAVDRVLDWAIKLSLYSSHAGRYGLNWDRLPFWAEVTDRLLERLEIPAPDGPTFLDQVTGPNTPIPEKAANLAKLLRAKGLDWEELRRVLAERANFLALDVRFGQLGAQGVFSQLDEAGLLDHRVPGVDNIEHAMENPPALGRARWRGAVVKRVAGEIDGDWKCGWDRIFSRKHGRLCDLSDPFATREFWRPGPPF